MRRTVKLIQDEVFERQDITLRDVVYVNCLFVNCWSGEDTLPEEWTGFIGCRFGGSYEPRQVPGKCGSVLVCVNTAFTHSSHDPDWIPQSEIFKRRILPPQPADHVGVKTMGEWMQKLEDGAGTYLAPGESVEFSVPSGGNR